MRQLDANALSGMLQTLGVPVQAAKSAAVRVDHRMKDCILKLYRSAVHVGDEWQADLSKVECPAMIFWGRNDKECPIHFAYEMAALLPNGHVDELDCGHWVPLERPKELAALLQRHWDSTESKSKAE